MTREAKRGSVVYASPGDIFYFVPPKPGKSYRFQCGPANGQLWICVCHPRFSGCVINKEGEDFVDCVCDVGEHIVSVSGYRTAFQFVVSRAPWAWVSRLKRLLGG